MRKTRFMKAVAVTVAIAAAGVAGASWAASQDPSDKTVAPAAGGGVSAAAINPSLVRERTFVPVTPCRAVDTRSAGGKLAANTSRGFDIFGTNLSAQGGSASGCGVPTFADTVAFNLISVEPGGTGYLRGSPQNLAILSPTAPTATLLSFASGPPRSNEVPLGMCQPGGLFACSGGDEIRIWAFTASTHVVIDVVGYYVTPASATVQGDGAISILRSNGLSNLTDVGTGSYRLDTDRDLRGCAIVTSVGNSGDENAGNNYAVSETNSTNLFVFIYNDAGVSEDDDFSVIALC
ncbi:MAG: hypothetical protein ABL966_01685 [Acidimicrobiales bacterium]